MHEHDVDDAPTTFAERLRDARIRRGWSQARLAREAGYDHSYLSRIERGNRTPSRLAVARLVDALALDTVAEDHLLVAAGYTPGDPVNLLAEEPVLMHALVILEHAPPAVAQHLRAAISDAVWLADRAMGRAA